jgi:hypothetical protein
VTQGPNPGASPDGAIIATGPEGLSVSVPAGGVKAGAVGLAIGLLFWLPAELWMGNLVWHARGRVDVFHFPAVLNAFPEVWLALWTIFGLSLIKGWLFVSWGHQQLIVGPSNVTLRATLLGQSRTKVFPVDQVQNARIFGRRGIRVLAMLPGRNAPEDVTIEQTSDVLASGTPIAFDVGGKEYRFGTTLSADTVRTILDAIERSRTAQSRAGG